MMNSLYVSIFLFALWSCSSAQVLNVTTLWVYVDGMVSPFENWEGGNPYTLDNISPVFEGQYSIAMELSAYALMQFGTNTAIDLSVYDTITLSVYTDTLAGAKFNIMLRAPNSTVIGNNIINVPNADIWNIISVPLEDFGLVKGSTTIRTIVIQYLGSQDALTSAYFDQIYFSPYQVPTTPFAIFTDSLQNNWVDYSWAERNLTITSPVHSGIKSVSVELVEYESLCFGKPSSPISYWEYQAIEFYVYGDSNLNSVTPQVTVIMRKNYAQIGILIRKDITIGSWTKINIDLSAFQLATDAEIDQIAIRGGNANLNGTIFIDDVYFISWNYSDPSTTTTSSTSASSIATTSDPFTTSSSSSSSDSTSGTSTSTTGTVSTTGDVSSTTSGTTADTTTSGTTSDASVSSGSSTGITTTTVSSTTTVASTTTASDSTTATSDSTTTTSDSTTATSTTSTITPDKAVSSASVLSASAVFIALTLLLTQ